MSSSFFRLHRSCSCDAANVHRDACLLLVCPFSGMEDRMQKRGLAQLLTMQVRQFRMGTALGPTAEIRCARRLAHSRCLMNLCRLGKLPTVMLDCTALISGPSAATIAAGCGDPFLCCYVLVG